MPRDQVLEGDEYRAHDHATQSQSHEEILNHFDHRLTTGSVEGENIRIKVIMRTGYGYRSMANWRLRILMTNPDDTYAAGVLLRTS